MNVLLEPMITITHGDGTRRVSLVDLLALLLTTEDVQGFPRLGADQRSYWWRFLVRSGARALRTESAGSDSFSRQTVTQATSTIRAALLARTDESDWLLHNPDPDRPAFLQSPTPRGGTPDKEKYKRNSAALLTAVIGTKEHERKSEVRRELDLESAIYALVEYQGGVIFGGRGNYESQLTGSRSGAGSGTPFMGIWIDRSHGKSFRHDVQALLDQWDETRKALRGDVWALWTVRWDGSTPMRAVELDPAFIPFARMVRLDEPRDDRMDTVWFRASKASRVIGPPEGGRLGDPFTPLIPDPKGDHLKVRGTLAKGYDYKEVVKLLLPKSAEDAVLAPSVAAAFDAPPPFDDVRVIFEGTAFEQGKTRGFHRRVVLLPKKAVTSGWLRQRSEPLHAAHEGMLRATDAAKRTLRSALAIILTGAPRARDDDREKMASVLSRVEELVDQRYLDELFHAVEADPEDPTLRYRQWLFEMMTQQVFPEALGALPRSVGRKWEEEVSAEAYLRGRLRRELDLPRTDDSKEAAA